MNPSTFSKSKSGTLVPIEEGCFAFIPNPLPPALEPDWALVSLISEADRALAELAGAARTLPNPHLLIRPFIGREAVLSSRIEGTQASLSDIFLFQGLEEKLPDEKKADIQEVVNYISALEHGLKLLSKLPLSTRFMRELHKILMHGVRGKDKAPGEFRTVQNWIGPPGCTKKTATYVPPPIPEMKSALNELEKFLHANSELPVLVRLAMVHYQFEAIHPFLDGNGRIGRLLITIMLCAEQLLPQPLLYLSAFFDKHRNDYYDGLLSVSRNGEWNNWISFFLRGVAEQSKDALLRSKSLVDLQQEYRHKLQSSRATGLQLRLLDFLFSTPIIRVNQVAKVLEITVKSAQQNIDKLVNNGILEETTGNKRNRIFIASAILKATETEIVS